MNRVLRVLALFALGAFVTKASAQDYPSNPISMIVPFAAGGPTDSLARLIADRMQAALGQSIVIVNATGAAGTIGVGRVVRSPPDGYTIGIGHWSTHVLNGAFYQLPYDLVTDLEPIALLPANPAFIIVKKDLPKQKTGIEGMLTNEQAEQYDGTLTVALKIYTSQNVLPIGRLEVTARQSLTLPQNAAPVDRERAVHQQLMLDVETRTAELGQPRRQLDDIAEPRWSQKARAGIDQRYAHDAVGRAELVRLHAERRLEQGPGAPIEEFEEPAVEDDAGRVAMAPFDHELPSVDEIVHRGSLALRCLRQPDRSPARSMMSNGG